MDYVKAFEREIATENLVADIGKKVMTVFKYIGELIMKAIRFLTSHLSKLAKIKKTDKDPTPNSQGEVVGAAAMQKKDPKATYAEDLYDCGNELIGVVADLEFCIQLLTKRPKPDHKTGKNYDQRWEQDNSLIADRMGRCMNTIEKLESIDKKTVSYETGTKLKEKLESLNASYDKYGRIYQMFLKQHPELDRYMISTQQSFNNISTVASKTLNMTLQLYTPAE